MTKQQKLTKVIERAMERGWVPLTSIPVSPASRAKHLLGLVGSHVFIKNLLFSHDFAKHYWGEKPFPRESKPPFLMLWQYHLQQAVLSKDPIDYYYKNK